MIPRLPGLTLLATVSLVGAQVVMSPASSPLQPEMQLWEQQVEEEEAALSSLGSLPNAPFDPCSEMPSIAPGESAILADGGMYFNNFKSCLIYVGNVRLSDAHVRLRSAHRLFLLLPEKDKKAAAEEISDADRPAHNAPQSPTPATTSQNLDSQQESAQPVEVLTQNAAVDVPGNRVLLQGLPGSPSLTFQRGEDTLTVQPQANGQPAKAYADKSGNVLLVGTRFVGRMSYGGESYELTAQQGPVEFDAAARTVTIHGPATLKSGRGELQCTRLMRISFAPGETLTKPSNEPFSQFANMRFGPVEKAEAHGEVVCTMPEQEGRPPARATGERLTYDGSTGACRMLGAPCTLAYGKQSLSTSGEICLKPNGDASVTGSDIAGTYERPVSNAKSSATIIGSFSTRGPILYNAADNCVSLPAGIDAQDDLANFSCTGNADIFLLRKEGTPPPRKPNGPNLMIVQQCGVARLHALGNVKLHSAATDSQPPINILCDSLKADAVHGTAHLLAQDGRAASLQYGSYSLCAQSPSSRIAEVQTLDNGDLLANGDVVLTKLPGDKGTTTVTCSKNLFLERERGLLFLGPQSVIDSPDGIMTAVAKLEAELLPGPPSAHPRFPKYPHLDYNFTGLRSADTSQGGTLRTAKASMQCDGPIHLRMAPGPAKSFRDALEQASARRHVRLAGKNAEGKLMRADGDSLDFDHSTGNIYLRGSRVTLMDEYNTHVASGRGACVIIDPKNNVHISGEHQTTTANRIHQQINSRQKK